MNDIQNAINIDTIKQIYLLSSTPEYFYNKVKDELSKIIDKSSFRFDDIISLYNENISNDPASIENEILCYVAIISAYFVNYSTALELIKKIDVSETALKKVKWEKRLLDLLLSEIKPENDHFIDMKKNQNIRLSFSSTSSRVLKNTEGLASSSRLGHHRRGLTQ